MLSPLTVKVAGGSDVRMVLEKLARDWDWANYRIESILVDGNRAVVHSRGQMRYVPKDELLETETLDLLTIENGKIAEIVQFCDTYAVVRKIGAHF